MRSLIAPRYGEPSIYELRDSELPKNLKPSNILVDVKAASVNGHDIIMASGKTKLFQDVPLPHKLGLDFAGVIANVGSDVKGYSAGDRIYGFTFDGGCIATQLLLDSSKLHAIAKMPDSLSFASAASLPAVAVTALQVLRRADTFFRDQGSNGLKGKTVFIPGALSGVGSVALQIAKRVYGCTTITAASTGKITEYPTWIGADAVDRAVDYTKDDVVQALGRGSVDFVFDTTGLAGQYVPLVKRGGLCLSIARIPPGSAMKEPGQPSKGRVACVGLGFMDGLDGAFRFWAKNMYGVVYGYHKTEPTNEDMVAVGEMVGEGSLRPVVGKTAALEDIETIRKVCMGMFKGAGGLGKFVIEMEEQ